MFQLVNPTIAISEQSIAIAGDSYSIVCRASVAGEINSLLTATWVSPLGVDLQTRLTDDVSVLLSQEGFTTVATLLFQPLHLSNKGVYECVAGFVRRPGSVQTGSTRQQHTLTVQGEFTKYRNTQFSFLSSPW